MSEALGDRLGGVLLFLPVPLVLFLYTRLPLGVVPSVALGTLLMVTHRIYARPFALVRAARRCLWCGSAAGEGPRLSVFEPGEMTFWRACGAEHADRLLHRLHWAEVHASYLRIGIIAALVLFLGTVVPAGAGRLGPLVAEDSVAVFRLAVALTVLPLGFWGRRPPSQEPPKVPYPLHIQSLIGTLWVLWLFRIVGVAWLLLGVLHLWRRAPALGVILP